MSKKRRNDIQQGETIEQVEVETVVEQTEEVAAEPEIVEEPVVEEVKEVTMPKYKVEVVGCQRLNVRDLPNGNVIGIVEKGTVLEAVLDKDGWVAVIGAGVNGYCKQEYLKEV